MTLRDRWQDLQFTRIAKSDRPILVGPWLSEVGFEALYWLPWLTAFCHTYQIDPARCIAVSRGGASAWYGVGQSAEVYRYLPMDSVRRLALERAQQQHSVKQFAIMRQEQTLLASIAEDLGIRAYHVLHPRLMYQQLNPWFEGQAPMRASLQRLAFAPIPTSQPPLAMPLPEQFIAVSFYARATWPLDEERRDWVQALVDGIQKICPVVLLESGQHTDDHIAFPINGCLSTAPYCTPMNNLQVQANVLAKAQAFIGTYGGTMQLAVRLKKPSVGFYTKFEGTAYAHKILTDWLAQQQASPCFVGRPEDAKYVQEVLQVSYLPQAHAGSSQVKQPA